MYLKGLCCQAYICLYIRYIHKIQSIYLKGARYSSYQVTEIQDKDTTWYLHPPPPLPMTNSCLRVYSTTKQTDIGFFT